MPPIETIAAGRFISLVRTDTWEYVTRNNASGVVIIVPLTADRKLLFVEQFRPPVGKHVIEFPAGLAGDIQGKEDEALELAAARELEEETGYRARNMTRAYTGPSSAGLCDEITTIFLATDLQRVGDGGGVDGEQITSHEVPLAEVDTWLAGQQQRGCYVAARVYTGLYLLSKA